MSDSRVSVGWTLRGRLLVLCGVVLAMVSPLSAVSSAEAAGASTGSLSASPSVAGPAESIVPSGVVSPMATATATQAISATPTMSVVKETVLGAPDLVLTQSTAIATETVKTTGILPGVYSRPIVVQRKSAAGWVTLVEATTSSTGSYATSFSAPDVGSYDVRVFAAKVKVAKQMRAEYVSAAKTLSVVAQSASMSMPTTLVESETGTATVTFGPARVGRAVALQVMTSGVWTAISTGEQSSTGTASIKFTAGTPGLYSYRAWTAAANGAPAFTSPASALEVTAAAPGPVTNVTATPSGTSIALSWNNPSDPSLSGVMIRRAVGATPPGSATAGTLVTDAAKPAISFIDADVTPGTQYSYALFAHNTAFGFAMAGTVTATTTVGVLPSITGTVTEAGPTSHGLANVRVAVFSPSNGVTNVTTVADGTYTVSGLPAGSDYTVCFEGSEATGGSSDSLGYLHHCFDNMPIWGEPMGGDPTPVTVTVGATRTSVDAALLVGGAISGIVRDAEGTQHGLAKVSVRVSIPSNGNYYGDASTAADGSYTVKGMPAGTDYQVCFIATGATGSSSDALGYLNQCFDNQPTSGTPTPVAVTLGAPSAGVDASLARAGAVSGTVIDAGGTQGGLANVSVGVYSASTGGNSSTTTAADGSYTAPGLPAATDYQVCFYTSGATGGSTDATGYVDQCYDNQPSGTPTPVTVTLGETRTAVDAAIVGGGAISGTVSDAGGTHHGLVNVWVSVSSLSNPNYGGYAVTAADGSYTMQGMAASTDYQVCFFSYGATGGSSDALGYLDQCYDNQPTSGTPTPVAVTPGAVRAGVDAALVGGSAISGTVIDAGGTQHGLENVSVQVTSMTYDINGGYAMTAADGTYTVPGLVAGTEYQVCFYSSGATGGSSDALGYVDQCYDNQPTLGTPTPVAVTVGATLAGINAALGPVAP